MIQKIKENVCLRTLLNYADLFENLTERNYENRWNTHYTISFGATVTKSNWNNLEYMICPFPIFC